MNLNASPSKAQLRQLLARQDDRAGHHVLWVDTKGDVHLSLVPAGLSATEFEQACPGMCLRYETFQKGNEYVGPAAAADEEWVSHLFESLLQEWAGRSRDGVEYVALG
jgi:hypothetical protein